LLCNSTTGNRHLHAYLMIELFVGQRRGGSFFPSALIEKLLVYFTLEPADNPLAADVPFNDLGLLLDSLLQTFLFTLKQEKLPIELLIAAQFMSQLFTTDLRHVLHIGLHSDEPLMVFLETFLVVRKLLDFCFVL